MRRQSLPWHRATTSPEFPATGEPMTTSAAMQWFLPANSLSQSMWPHSCTRICPADAGGCMPANGMSMLYSASVATL